MSLFFIAVFAALTPLAAITVTTAALARFTWLALLFVLRTTLVGGYSLRCGIQVGVLLGWCCIACALTVVTPVVAAAIAFTTLATLTARGFLASVCCRAAHGCSHRGFVGQCNVLLSRIHRCALLTTPFATLAAFTARALLATALSRLSRLTWWAWLALLLAFTSLFAALFIALLTARLSAAFAAFIASAFWAAFISTFRATFLAITAFASGTATPTAITAAALATAVAVGISARIAFTVVFLYIGCKCSFGRNGRFCAAK